MALILGLVLAGCSLPSNVGQVPTNEKSGISYLTKEPPTDLVALWHFDEGVGTTASDSSGNGNNGTLKPTGSDANTKISLDTTSAAHYFNGLIDEVRIWDKALQPEDILNPDILVEKSGSKSAHVDDIIIYTYTVINT